MFVRIPGLAEGSMGLNLPAKWRFDAPGEALNPVVVSMLQDFIFRIAAQGDRWSIVENFKRFFAGAAGATYHRSSSASWAESDLDSLMHAAAKNAPLFIEAFYEGCQAIQVENPRFGVPDVARVNRVLAEHETGYEIRPPDLLFTRQLMPVVMPERQPSLDEQAQALIGRSLGESERLLLEGRNRQAVAEILWLLETVVTAFRGVDTGGGTVQEKYFTTIAKELRRQQKGQMLEQVLNWVTTLYGFLSSPTGGGVRHGTDIRNVAEMPAGDARLYCNLIRSYIDYLMAEHERFSQRGPGSSTGGR
jgi:hypothetical protein